MGRKPSSTELGLATRYLLESGKTPAEISTELGVSATMLRKALAGASGTSRDPKSPMEESDLSSGAQAA